MSIPNDERFQAWEVPFAVCGATAIGFWLAAVFEYREGVADLSFVEQIQIVLVISLSMKLLAQAKAQRVSLWRMIRESLAVLGVVAGVAFAAFKFFSLQSAAAWLGVPIVFVLWALTVADVYKSEAGR